MFFERVFQILSIIPRILFLKLQCYDIEIAEDIKDEVKATVSKFASSQIWTFLTAHLRVCLVAIRGHTFISIEGILGK